MDAPEDKFYRRIARFAEDLSAAYGETEDCMQEWRERSGHYGEMRTHTRRWTEQTFSGDATLPAVTITWGSGARHDDRDREVTFQYLDETRTIGYDRSPTGRPVNIAGRDDLPDDGFWTAAVDDLVTKAYDWRLLDGVGDEAAAALADLDALRSGGGTGDHCTDCDTDQPPILKRLIADKEQHAARYEETRQLLEPPMAGVPLTTGPDELAERLEPVYEDEGTANQVAGRIVAQNPELFPAAERDDA